MLTMSREEIEEHIRTVAVRASEEREWKVNEEAKERDEREKQGALIILRTAYKRMTYEAMPEPLAESMWIEPASEPYDYGPAYRAFVAICGQTFSVSDVHGRAEFTAVRKCPRCGSLAEWLCYDTAGLGTFFRRLAAGEDPFGDHHCPGPPPTFPAPQVPPPPEAAEQRLVTALREFIAEARGGECE